MEQKHLPPLKRGKLPPSLHTLRRQMRTAHRIVVNSKLRKVEKIAKLKAIGYAKSEANSLLTD